MKNPFIVINVVISDWVDAISRDRQEYSLTIGRFWWYAISYVGIAMLYFWPRAVEGWGGVFPEALPFIFLESIFFSALSAGVYMILGHVYLGKKALDVIASFTDSYSERAYRQRKGKSKFHFFASWIYLIFLGLSFYPSWFKLPGRIWKGLRVSKSLKSNEIRSPQDVESRLLFLNMTNEAITIETARVEANLRAHLNKVEELKKIAHKSDPYYERITQRAQEIEIELNKTLDLVVEKNYAVQEKFRTAVKNLQDSKRKMEARDILEELEASRSTINRGKEYADQLDTILRADLEAVEIGTQELRELLNHAENRSAAEKELDQFINSI